MQKKIPAALYDKGCRARMGCMSEKNNAVNDSLPADTSSIPYLMCIGKRSRKGVFMAKKINRLDTYLKKSCANSG